MEPSQLVEEARKKLSIADHFMFVTYPMVKETKMLKTIMDHTADAVFMAMKGLLESERKEKRIMHLTGNFYADLEIFRREVAPRHKFTPKDSLLLQELKSFTESKKKSHMEFVRGEKYVFTFEDFSMKVFNEEKVKKVIEAASAFITKAERAVC
ncbi:hypothetical protein HY501_01220 [Candidatus Woesearchaeota archaeon]|nr:hypothetical protein [Candidatus Woesearchaeota archaeon]